MSRRIETGHRHYPYIELVCCEDEQRQVEEIQLRQWGVNDGDGDPDIVSIVPERLNALIAELTYLRDILPILNEVA